MASKGKNQLSEEEIKERELVRIIFFIIFYILKIIVVNK